MVGRSSETIPCAIHFCTRTPPAKRMAIAYNVSSSHGFHNGSEELYINDTYIFRICLAILLHQMGEIRNRREHANEAIQERKSIRALDRVVVHDHDLVEEGIDRNTQGCKGTERA